MKGTSRIRYLIQDILLSFCEYNYRHIRLFMEKVYKNIIYASIDTNTAITNSIN